MLKVLVQEARTCDTSLLGLCFPPARHGRAGAVLDLLMEEQSNHIPDVVCEHCGSDRVVLVGTESKPNWRELLGWTTPTLSAAVR